MFNILNYYKIILKANKKHKFIYAFNLCFKFFFKQFSVYVSRKKWEPDDKINLESAGILRRTTKSWDRTIYYIQWRT